VFYGIEYEINPWMKRERQADHDLAIKQWNDLLAILIDLGAKVSLLTPQRGLPDLVFTANAAMIFRRTAVLSRFRFEQRQGEEEHDSQWLAEHGFEVVAPPEKSFFEGAGDALFCGEDLFAGYRMRSDARGHQEIGRRLGVRVIPMELVDPYYYHLDTCFCPLKSGAALIYAPAFDEYGQAAVRELIPDLIPVEQEEAQSFDCNAVVVGQTVVTNTGCPHLQAGLKSRGYGVVETPLSEFVKAGGSAKCLTLRLDGEEAAAWRTTPTA
jgi:N-dimethylarginine dimethylaminohydrolase